MNAAIGGDSSDCWLFGSCSSSSIPCRLQNSTRSSDASVELGGGSFNETGAEASTITITKRTWPAKKAAHGRKSPPSPDHPGLGGRTAQSHRTSLRDARPPRLTRKGRASAGRGMRGSPWTPIKWSGVGDEVLEMSSPDSSDGVEWPASSVAAVGAVGSLAVALAYSA
jgi:hypothetical protein